MDTYVVLGEAVTSGSLLMVWSCSQNVLEGGVSKKFKVLVGMFHDPDGDTRAEDWGLLKW